VRNLAPAADVVGALFCKKCCEMLFEYRQRVFEEFEVFLGGVSIASREYL
jgi:hypothetical protein